MKSEQMSKMRGVACSGWQQFSGSPTRVLSYPLLLDLLLEALGPECRASCMPIWCPTSYQNDMAMFFLQLIPILRVQGRNVVPTPLNKRLLVGWETCLAFPLDVCRVGCLAGEVSLSPLWALQSQLLCLEDCSGSWLLRGPELCNR